MCIYPMVDELITYSEKTLVYISHGTHISRHRGQAQRSLVLLDIQVQGCAEGGSVCSALLNEVKIIGRSGNSYLIGYKPINYRLI